MFHSMSMFWSPKGKRQGPIVRPWRHELEKGILKVRWNCADDQFRYKNPVGVVLDWCDDYNLKYYYESVTKMPGYKYFYHKMRKPLLPLALVIEIPAEPW